MTAMKTISAALKLIDAKKENLRKSFEELQAHSSSLSSFTLKWSDLDSYFTSFQSSLEHKFELLQSLEPPQSQPSKDSKPSPKKPLPQLPSSAAEPVRPARPRLKSFCEKMDGLGLRRYIVDRPKERTEIKVELPDAFRCAPDVAAMVLDGMEGFFPQNSRGDKDFELSSIRRSCMILLEVLMEVKPEIGAEVKERAMNLALEWKAKTSVNGENPFEALGFLHLLAAYCLVDGFNKNELMDYVVIVAKYRQAIHLCRVLNFEDKISDLIQKLCSDGKQLLAVKFIFEFEVTDKFPPVPLLKASVKESKKLSQKVRKSGNQSRQSLNEATAKEVSALKSVVKYIEDYKLESEYPKDILVKHIEKLEKDKESRKRSAAAPVSMPQQQSNPLKQSGSKHPRTAAVAAPATIPNSVAANSIVPLLQQPPSTVPQFQQPPSTFSPFQQPHLQTAGLLPDHPAPYLSLPAEPYGLLGSNPAVAPYTGSSDGLYGLSGASLGFSGNLVPTGSNPYPSESLMPSGYYDRPIAYGGYGLPPQYHPSYYPQ